MVLFAPQTKPLNFMCTMHGSTFVEICFTLYIESGHILLRAGRFWDLPDWDQHLYDCIWLF